MSFLSSPFPFQQLHPTGPFPCPRLPQVPLSTAECSLLNISAMGDSGGHLSWLSLCRWGNQGPKTWRDGPTITQLLCPEPRREPACSKFATPLLLLFHPNKISSKGPRRGWRPPPCVRSLGWEQSRPQRGQSKNWEACTCASSSGPSSCVFWVNYLTPLVR